MSQLSAEQLAQVEIWAADGANLHQVQDRLKTEFGINLTYLDARLLMLDVGVRLKDKPREPEKTPEPEAAPQADAAEAELTDTDEGGEDLADLEDTPVPAGSLEMSADQIAVPGSVISGKVTFSDGQKAVWFLDQMGRLGLSGAPQGYQPPPADIPIFQQQLDIVLQKAGF